MLEDAISQALLLRHSEIQVVTLQCVLTVIFSIDLTCRWLLRRSPFIAKKVDLADAQAVTAAQILAVMRQ